MWGFRGSIYTIMIPYNPWHFRLNKDAKRAITKMLHGAKGKSEGERLWKLGDLQAWQGYLSPVVTGPQSNMLSNPTLEALIYCGHLFLSVRDPQISIFFAGQALDCWIILNYFELLYWNIFKKTWYLVPLIWDFISMLSSSSKCPSHPSSSKAFRRNW